MSVPLSIRIRASYRLRMNLPFGVGSLAQAESGRKGQNFPDGITLTLPKVTLYNIMPVVSVQSRLVMELLMKLFKSNLQLSGSS